MSDRTISQKELQLTRRFIRRLHDRIDELEQALKGLREYGKLPGCVNCGYVADHLADCPWLIAERALAGVSIRRVETEGHS